MAKVSIIIPAYNSEKHIGKCLDSIFSQTHDDLEVILVDDCSTDKSYDVMRLYSQREPRRLKLVKNQENKGAGASRNVGLELAQGKYIGFIDSDDTIELNAVKKMHDTLEKKGVDIARISRKIVYKGHDVSFLGRKLAVREDGIIVPKQELEYLTEDSPAVTNKMFRRELIGDKKFPEDLKWEDYPFSIPLMYQASGIATAQGTNYNYNLNFAGTTVGDATKVSPRLLDIFKCSDMIKEEILTEEDVELKARIDFLCIQNCLQRIRDVLYSNLPLKEKKELINLISTLINKKYGNWQTNPLYLKYKNTRKIYKLTMNIASTFIDDRYNDLEVEQLEQEIQKILTKKNQ